MARIRTIKPEFPHSESMGRVSRDARLLFMLLWTIADDEGRFRAASRLLASLLYPYDDDAPSLMDGWLRELSREDCITLYVVDGTTYGVVSNWLKHQKIDHASRSKLPPPPDDIREASRSLAPDLGKGSGPRTMDLDQDHRTKEGTAASRSRGGANGAAPARAGPTDWPDDYRERFEAAYPHKVGMAPALKALDKVRAEGRVTWRVVIAALDAYAAKTDDRAWMNPKNWLEQERWNDRPAKPTGNAPRRSARPSPGDRARRLAGQVAAREREGAVERPPDAVGGAELGGDDARLVPRARPE